MMSKLSYSRIKRRKLFIGKQVAENLQILSHDALLLLMMQFLYYKLNCLFTHL